MKVKEPIELPLSPHIESYKQFRNYLADKVRDWLSEMIDEFQEDEIIDFNPVISLNEITKFRSPAPEEENSCRVNGETLEERIKLKLSLAEDQGFWDWDIGPFPRMTERGSFIYNGNERCIVAQLTKSPGLFFSWEEKEEIRAFGPHKLFSCKIRFAVAKLRPEHGTHFDFRMEVAPGKRAPRVVFSDRRTAYLATFLDALGFKESEIGKIFKNAEDIYTDVIRYKSVGKETKKQDISHIAQCIGLGTWLKEESLSIGEEDKAKIREKTQQKFFSSVLGKLSREQVNRRIILSVPEYNETSERITKEDIAGILKAFVAFAQNNDENAADDPWDIGNLKVRLVGDYLEAGLTHWFKWMKLKIRRFIEKEKEQGHKIDYDTFKEFLLKANLDTEKMTHFSRLINEWIIHSPMSQIIPADQNNLLEAAALTRKITYNGNGGISVGHEREPRDFHWSHYGRLCPLDTPQSDDIGVSLSLTIGARVNELGIVETACYKVSNEDGKTRIGGGIHWLSPWEEARNDNNNWIAFPDQKDALVKGKKVQAHRGSETLKMVSANKVAFIHASEEAMYSLAANMIPFRRHNDAVRGVMACSAMRQALPLKENKPPKVKTGFEKLIPQKYPFPYGSLSGKEMAFGKEILVAYLPWKGWNFEDAFVISRSASEELTNVFIKTVTIKLRRLIDEQRKVFEKLKNKKSGLPEDIDINRYDERGIIQKGATVADGDLLVLEPESMKSQSGKKKKTTLSDHSVKKDVRGEVTSVDVLSEEGRPARLRIVITDYRQAEIGDKLANRHGHKGVISRIYEDHEMPYFLIQDDSKKKNKCDCGETRPHYHLEMLINPISVISRINLGQLYETIEARDGVLKKLPEKVDCYDPAQGNLDERKLKKQVFIGRQYIMKLDHNASDKIHARSRVPRAYNAFVEQPLKGRRLEGGQRLGEMEVWALMAHNASGIIKELLTLKSDNPRERKILFHSLLQGKGGLEVPHSRLPEALTTMAACCAGLGIFMTIYKTDGKPLDPLLGKCNPEEVDYIKLSILESEKFVSNVSKGEIKTSITSGRTSGYKYHPEGLESEQIFGPVKDFTCTCDMYYRYKAAIGKCPPIVCGRCNVPLLPSYHRRHRMGHITLVCPVPNPFFLEIAGEEIKKYLGLTSYSCRSILNDRPRIDFGKRKDGEAWENANTFLTTALRGSEQFKKALEEKIGGPLMEDDGTYEASSLKSEDFLKLKELLKELVKGEEGLTIKKFWESLEARYGRNLLTGLEGLVGAAIVENHISGCDLIADMLKVHEETKHLCLNILPVIPPILRLKFKIPDGNLKPHDLNVLYRGVLNTNASLAEVAGNLDSMDIEKRKEYMRRRRDLQLVVAQLLCNERLPARDRARDWSIPGRPVRYSLSSYLEGKEGLIVGNLLGKRVDFSGRAVIVPDPTLSLDKCRIPFRMALILFYPHLIASMGGKVTTALKKIVKMAEAGVAEAVDEIKPKLIEILKSHNILLNRQPTLHRLGLLGFKTEIGEGSVLAIPPLITAGYNADFDGDQMAVYLPLTQEAKDDLPFLSPSNHIWHPADGRFAFSLAQDLALGGYLEGKGSKKEIARTFEERGWYDENVLSDIQDFADKAFERVTQEGISFSIEDLRQIADKSTTGEDQKNKIKEIICSFDNPFKNIILSGARGNWETMNYLAGNVYKNRENSNLTMGLQTGEQLHQAKFGRRNLVDTKLGTAEGGSLTKDLISIAQHLWISEENCGTEEGLPVSDKEEFWLLVDDMHKEKIKELVEENTRSAIDGKITAMLWDEDGCGEFTLQKRDFDNINKFLKDHPARIPPRLVGIRIERKIGETEEERGKLIYMRLYGRILAQKFDSYEIGTYLDRDSVQMITRRIVENGDPAFVRSPVTCNAKGGICKKCFGLPLIYGKSVENWNDEALVPLDNRVGVIAAQAVSEPGTQMALRKKHLAGGHKQGEVESSTGVDEAKKCFQSSTLLLIEEKKSIYRDTVDHIYRSHGITIAPIHFEVLFEGMFRTLSSKRSGEAGWISPAAHPDRNLETDQNTLHVLAVSALYGKLDTLEGLKERALIGGHLPFVEEEGK